MNYKRIYHPYYLWEDYKNGLYNNKLQPELINSCVELLQNKKHFYESARLLTKSWVYCCEVNLTNNEMNRKAWIGQATCCFRFGANSETVIVAWHKLDNYYKDEANMVADIVIKEYINKKIEELCPKLDLE